MIKVNCRSFSSNETAKALIWHQRKGSTMKNYEKPVMEIELFDEKELEILTDPPIGSPENLGKNLNEELPTRLSC